MTSEAKQHLREQLKQQRASLPVHDREAFDAVLTNAVEALPQFEAAPLVLTYLSFGDEVDTRSLIQYAWSQGKRVALPKCQRDGQMTWHLVESFDDLITSKFGIDEPDESKHAQVQLSHMTKETIAIVPGLAFDARGYRIGYGGGFYDRFLRNFPGTSIGLCRPQAFFESLSSYGVIEDHDLSVDMVISNEEHVL